MKLAIFATLIGIINAGSVYLRCECNHARAFGYDGRQLQIIGLTALDSDQTICNKACEVAQERDTSPATDELTRSLRKRRAAAATGISTVPVAGPGAFPQSAGVAGIDGLPVPPGPFVEAGPFNPYFGPVPGPRQYGPYHPGPLPGRVPVGYYPDCPYHCREQCPGRSPCSLNCGQAGSCLPRAPLPALAPAPVLEAPPPLPEIPYLLEPAYAEEYGPYGWAKK